MDDSPFSSLEREPDLLPRVELLQSALKCVEMANGLYRNLIVLQAPDTILESLNKAIHVAYDAIMNEHYGIEIHTLFMNACNAGLDWKAGDTTNA